MTDWPGPHVTPDDIERRVIGYVASLAGRSIQEFSANTALSNFFPSSGDLLRLAEGLNELNWVRQLGVRVEALEVLQARTIGDLTHIIWQQYRSRNPRNA